MKKTLLAQLILPLILLVGCGKGDDNANTQAVGVAPQFAGQINCPSCTNSPAITISGTYGYYYASYQFHEQGSCNTGFHQFSGRWAEQVRYQVCQGLRNGYYNGSHYGGGYGGGYGGYAGAGGCSPNLRQQAIAHTCTPYGM